MNGPEHYREAERLLGIAEQKMRGYAGTRDKATKAIHLAQAEFAHRRAQVHATLAQVAATANTGGDETRLVEQPSAWDQNRQGGGVTWAEVLL